MIQFSVVTLLVIIEIACSLAAKADINCPGGKLTPEARQQFLDRHNILRSRLAKGYRKNKDGIKMPKAKNMFKLNYSCKLEKLAQERADECSHFIMMDENGMGYTVESLNSSEIIKESPRIAIDFWWGTLKTNYSNNPSNIFSEKVSDEGSDSFVRMAWGATYAIGCGIAAKCNGKITSVICNYEPPPEVGKQIYEIGNPCRRGSDCTSKKCSPSEGLCIKQ